MTDNESEIQPSPVATADRQQGDTGSSLREERESLATDDGRYSGDSPSAAMHPTTIHRDALSCYIVAFV